MEQMKQIKGNTVKYFLKEKTNYKKKLESKQFFFFYGNERKPYWKSNEVCLLSSFFKPKSKQTKTQK